MMTYRALKASAALLATLALVTAPAWAGQRDRGSNRSGQGTGRAVERSEAPRSESPRATEPRSAPREDAAAPSSESRPSAGNRRGETRQNNEAPRSEPRSDAGSRSNEPRRDVAIPRTEPRRDANPPGYEQRNDRRYSPRYEPRYEPRYAPRYDSRYSSRNDWRSSYSYRPHYLYRQPYFFRPWFTLGFGIYAGYPVPYTYAYPYPIYGYSAPTMPVIVGPGSAGYGGASLDIRPNDAEVYVDGGFAGQVSDFDGAGEPLTLVVGTHRIDIAAPGYETLTIDVNVQPGQIIPYRGELRRLPY